ncbi:hypothetical protein [Nocardioides sp.]|uniref:hypothetical protein n=1 Tax=Nocardioides sp. TaxID=35761 RepID=UPI002CB70C20|nr:hypothetical protein [Nocardioides sp.]HXH78358.1 hypothetical protein [Nocardioides sp.]
MDDVDYARELYRILTTLPDPEVPPGHLGDDWIDRCDGFGTEVKVTAIDVVPGEQGSQLDITFVLDLPDDLDVPHEGSMLLPLDAEWRDLSGYTEPEDYAPHVARRLVHNIHRRVRAYEPSRAEDDRDLPSRAEQHAMLLEVLGRRGQVEEQAANRYVIRRQQRDGLIALLTPDQWERVIHRHGLRRAGLLEHFDELFASTPREERFLVFWDGDATTSTREELPPAKKPWPPLREIRQRLSEARASGRDFGWYAYKPGSRD